MVMDVLQHKKKKKVQANSYQPTSQPANQHNLQQSYLQPANQTTYHHQPNSQTANQHNLQPASHQPTSPPAHQHTPFQDFNSYNYQPYNSNTYQTYSSTYQPYNNYYQPSYQQTIPDNARGQDTSPSTSSTNSTVLIGAPWRQVAVPAPVIAQVASLQSETPDKSRAAKVRALMDAIFKTEEMVANNTDGSVKDGLGRLDENKLNAIREHLVTTEPGNQDPHEPGYKTKVHKVINLRCRKVRHIVTKEKGVQK
ncbi:uncharacterized protein LOC118407456 [Branchiostoma floridae]|uniref:Uncharacterized protein LOC118407456 n=1 Tax=Branchiostoma floridae TaxID=7739 RepID=A0A9J7HSZ6_BRAFL|nr:uncharacterized protein LOC118407456 [Branchiostoma floridae]